MDTIAWVIIPASIIGFGASFAVGSNDVGNALGTSIGSRALSIRSAILLGSVMEFLGVITIGHLVSATLKEQIIMPSAFSETPELFVLGMFSVLCSSFVWLLVATLLSLPVSTTHTIVSGIFAFGVFEKGSGPLVLNANRVIMIGVSWVVSPIAGLIAGGLIYYVVHRFVLIADDVKKRVDYVWPFLAGLNSAAVCFLLVKAISKVTPIPWFAYLISGVLVLVLGWLLAWRVVLPWWYNNSAEISRRANRFLLWGMSVDKDDPSKNPEDAHSIPSDLDADVNAQQADDFQNAEESEDGAGNVVLIEYGEEVTEAQRLFVSLMVITAAMVAFAHASNDIANSCAPFLVCLEWAMHRSIGKADFDDPFWVFAAAGAALVLGLALLGYRVMRTIGSGISDLNNASGFCAQFAAACVVVTASLLGLPISTTHCIVASVAGTALATRRGRATIKWKMILKIVGGWIFTMLIGAGLTLAIYAPLRLLIV